MDQALYNHLPAAQPPARDAGCNVEHSEVRGGSAEDQGPHTKKAVDLRMNSGREMAGKLGFEPREPSAFAGNRATFQAAVTAEGDRAPRRLSTAIMTFQACLAGSASTRADVCPEMSTYRGHRFCSSASSGGSPHSLRFCARGSLPAHA